MPRLLCAVLGDDGNFPLTDDLGPEVQAREPACSPVRATPSAKSPAASPHDMIATPDIAGAETRRWHHGKPEAWNAASLCELAIKALVSTERQFAAPPPEPG